MRASRKTTRDRTMMAIAIIPPVSLVLFCVSAAAKWRFGEAKIRPLLEQVLTPELIDAPSPGGMDYDARTSDEKTTQFRELNFAIDSVNSKYQILFELLEEQSDWTENLDQERPTDKYVQSYLDEVQPLLQSTERLAAAEESIWMPHEMGNPNRYSEALLSRQNLFDMMRLEFRAAVRAKETDRAIKAFRLSRSLVAGPVALKLNPLLPSVAESFGTGVWNESEVEQLIQLIGNESEWDQAWQRQSRNVLLEQVPWLMHGEIVDAWRRDPIPITYAPSRRIEWMKNAERQSRVNRIGTLSAVKKTLEIEADSVRDSTTQLDTALQIPLYGQMYHPGGSRSYLARTFAAEANDRRLARTAAALAIYKLKFDAYPDQLAELSKVGLADDDMRDPTGGTFRYVLEDDGYTLGNASIWFRASGGHHDSREDTLADLLKENREIHFR